MEILIIDLETTHLNENIGEILEIGAILLDTETGRTTKLCDALLRPKKDVKQWCNCWAINNTNICENDVLNAKYTLEDLRETLQSYFLKYPTTAYNNEFDFKFLEAAGFKITKKLECPMKLITPILKLPPKWQGTKYKYPNFQEAWNYFFPTETDYKEKHRAYDDAEHEAKLVFKLIKDGIMKL